MPIDGFCGFIIVKYSVGLQLASQVGADDFFKIKNDFEYCCPAGACCHGFMVRTGSARVWPEDNGVGLLQPSVPD